jgi:N-acetylmuramoyl-L-alanine amidase
MRKISAIVIHCSATPEGRVLTVKDIDRMHRERGFNGVGYHYVIRLDGTIDKGRPDAVPGAHVAGHNFDTIGICYIGGVDAKMKAKDTRTQAQRASMRKLVDQLLEKHPKAKVCGHRDFPKVAKDCPSFSVADWLKETATAIRY